MELPEKLLEDVAGSGHVKWEKIRRDKRSAARAPVGRRAMVLRKSGNLSVVIREVSATGVGLLSSVAMGIGDEFILCLPRQKKPAEPVKCRVVRRDGGGSSDGGYIIGAVFTEILSDSGDITPAQAAEAERIRRAMFSDD